MTHDRLFGRFFLRNAVSGRGGDSSLLGLEETRMRLLIGLLFAVAIGACGSAAIPASGTLTDTQAAIRGAEEVGARNVPKAALHLKMAQDQLKTAEALLADGEEKEAAVVLARAESDAELAITLAKEANIRVQANEALKKTEQLKRGE
jgi:hypothetical protein